MHTTNKPTLDECRAWLIITAKQHPNTVSETYANACLAYLRNSQKPEIIYAEPKQVVYPQNPVDVWHTGLYVALGILTFEAGLYLCIGAWL